MTLAAIQPYFAGLISADAQLSPFGAPIQVDPFQDPNAAKAAIAAALRATGVSIEVGFPWISAPETDLGGSTLIQAMCEVFVAESPTVAHTPEKIDLLTRAISACTVRPNAIQKPARLRSSESLKIEGGTILHMLSFFVPLNLTQP